MAQKADPRPRRWAVLLAIAAFASLSAQATCPLASFGVDRQKNTCGRDACRTHAPPPEIGAIQRGAYSESVSLDLYVSLSSWVGVDVDKAQIVTIERYPDSMLPGLIEVRKRQKDPGRFVVRRPDTSHVDVVRRYPVPAAKLREFVCAANKLWKAGDAELITPTTGGYTAIFIVDVAASRGFDGLGIPIGDLKALSELMESLKDPEWSWFGPLN